MPRIFLLALIFVLFSPTARAVSADPEKFVAEYYQVKQAKNDFKGLPAPDHFFSKRLVTGVKEIEKKSALEQQVAEKLADALNELMGATENITQVKIDKYQITENKAVFELSAKETPPSYKIKFKDAKSLSVKGDLVLIKEEGAWKIDKEMWNFTPVYDKNRTKDFSFSSSFSFGLSGPEDDAESANTSPWPAPKNFEEKVRRNLMDRWRPQAPGTGKSIYALMTLANDGKIVTLKVRGEKPQADAEKQITQLLTSTPPFQPLPVDLQNKPYVWMMFDWSAKGNGIAVSGPYFNAEPHPQWLREAVGLSSGDLLLSPDSNGQVSKQAPTPDSKGVQRPLGGWSR